MGESLSDKRAPKDSKRGAYQSAQRRRKSIMEMALTTLGSQCTGRQTPCVSRSLTGASRTHHINRFGIGRQMQWRIAMQVITVRSMPHIHKRPHHL